jgi:hypothetical protein
MNFQNFPKIFRKIRTFTVLLIFLGLLSPNFLIFAETQTQSGNVFLEALVLPPIIPPTPPISPILEIFDIQVLEITDSSALIYWKTFPAATSFVTYGKTENLEIGTVSEESYVSEHKIRLVGLEANTLYYFQISGRSKLGAKAKSAILTFKTLTDTTPPANVSEFTATPGIRQIQLSWKNPKDLDFKGVRIRRSTEYFPLSPEEGELVYDGPEESYLDKNLTPGVRYYYTAFAYDTSGNFASGAVASAVPLPIVGPPPPIPVPPVEIEVLKITDFHFQIAQKTINVFPDPLYIFHFLPGTILHLSIETEKLPKVLKTIMVVIGDKSYLLRIDESGKFYQAGLALPLREGLQPIYILVLNFKEGTIDKIEGSILIEPFGKIKQLSSLTTKQFNKGVEAAEVEEGPVYLAKVTLYQLDEVSREWKEWPALKYSQRNPIYSNPEGQYGFLVPRGKYFVQVEKENYETLKTKEIFVEKNFINQDIVLKQLPKPGLFERLSWLKPLLILLILILFSAGIIIYRKKKYKRNTKEIQ